MTARELWQAHIEVCEDCHPLPCKVGSDLLRKASAESDEQRRERGMQVLSEAWEEHSREWK